ncbi:MAG: hypothetical protein L3K26_20615, partial [Candidatus Hydrogenedentes bacterium]|nr:hypothetical protein [Candidatus Hydrogenedentota bacterium]
MPIKPVLFFVLCTLALAPLASAQDITVTTDPITRYFHITYPVLEDAPEVVQVHATFSPTGSDAWQKASVMPLVSETALRMLPPAAWTQWASEGRITERRAAGLMRTLVFNPYPDAQVDGKVDVDFRIEIRGEGDAVLATYTTHLQGDNSDVAFIEDWSQIFQQENIQEEGGDAPQKWQWRTGWDAALGMSQGNSLYGDAGKELPMPQLSYRLDLKGWYAIYVHIPGAIRLRFTGDERSDLLSSRKGEEVL